MAYVYGHYKPGTDELFYIGKGSGKRAYSRAGRNNLWHKTIKKYGGFVVKILRDELTDVEAEQIEIQLIQKYGKRINESGCLVNIADGGGGNYGWVESEEQKRIRIQKTIEACQNPELRERRSIASLESQNRPEVKEKHSEASSKMWSTAGFREKRARAFALAKEEGRFGKGYLGWGAARAEYQRKLREDSEYRAKYSESVKRGWETRRKNQLKE
jgi:hypothetical protein